MFQRRPFLQGNKDRIDQTLATIRAGSKKSSQNNTISQVTAAWDPDLKTFTVFAWTSTSRNIMNPYDLVFSLRPANDQISHKDAKAIWNNIAKSTLKGDDLAKFLFGPFVSGLKIPFPGNGDLGSKRLGSNACFSDLRRAATKRPTVCVLGARPDRHRGRAFVAR